MTDPCLEVIWKAVPADWAGNAGQLSVADRKRRRKVLSWFITVLHCICNAL